MSKRLILVNPGHGYEPTRLGIQIALKLLPAIKADGIILPDVTDRVDSMLHSEFAGSEHLVEINSELSDIYKKGLTDITSYSDHIQFLSEYKDKLEGLAQLCIKDLRKHFNVEIVLEIITGSRIVVTEIAPVIYVFEGLLSSILEMAKNEGIIGDTTTVRSVIESMKLAEENYTYTFIPDSSPFVDNKFFSHLKSSPILTPPLRTIDVSRPKYLLDKPSLFVMMSGTGRGSKAVEMAKSLKLPFVSNKFTDRFTGFDPKEIFGPNVLGVITRGGAGTQWICQLAEKPQIFIPFESDDDPEIYFNIEHYCNLGVGVRSDHEDLNLDLISSCIPSIRKLNDATFVRYGTLDGIDFLTSRVKHLLGLSNNKSKALMLQYEQIRQDMRDYNRSVWQTPGVALSIEIALITIIFGTDISLNSWEKSAIIFVTNLLVISLLLTFVKHAHFHGLKAQLAHQLAMQIGMEEEHFPKIPWSKRLKILEKMVAPKCIQGVLTGVSAVNWQARVLYIVIAANLAMSIIYLLKWINGC